MGLRLFRLASGAVVMETTCDRRLADGSVCGADAAHGYGFNLLATPYYPKAKGRWFCGAHLPPPPAKLTAGYWFDNPPDVGPAEAEGARHAVDHA